MTGAVLDRPAPAGGLGPRSGGRPGLGGRPAHGERPAPRGRLTLEELLTTTLHEALANGSTECPVCHARMTPARAGAAAGCGGCGSVLS
jgi:hypothetical protein